MKNGISLLVLIVCSQITLAQVSFSQRLKPSSNDVYISNFPGSPTSPDEIDFCSGQWTIGGVPAAYRTFFQFDFSSIPAGSIINSASLNLYYPDTNSWSNAPDQSLTNTNTSLLQRVLSSWNESTILWSNQPSVTSFNGDTLPESISPTQDYLNIDVTNMVQAMVDSGNYGFSVRLKIEQQYARLFFASGDNPDSTQHPLIEITYTPPTICLTQQLLPKSEDATIDDYAPGNNHPDEIEYFCGGWTIFGTPVRWRNLFKFDLSAIPLNATIQSASLSLYFPVQNNFFATDTSLTHLNTSIIYRITSWWSENSVTWNNAPSYSTNNPVNIGPSTSSNQDFLNIDVASLVQDMVNDPNNSYGFQVQMIDESQYARLLFASGDNPDINSVPTLEVCYTETVGINQIADNEGVSIYPNPASDQFHVTLKDGPIINQYQLYDMCGKLLERRSVKNQSDFIVDVSHLSDGVYFLSLDSEKFHSTRSLIIQH